MKLIITKYNLGLWAAAYIQRCIQNTDKKTFVLGLPTGSTVLDMYAALSAMAQNGKINFKNIQTFNMDEYAGLPPEHPQSYHFYMQEHLLDKVNIPPNQAHILNGCAPDLEAECCAYETAIAQAGGIDLFLGGVGRNGHLAFNEPGSAFDSRTRVIDLTDSTKQANSRFFGGDPNAVPAHALTVGIGTILDAKELLFLASGAAKAQAVAHLAQGKITEQWPISALKLHKHATLLLDPAAAAALDKAALSRAQENTYGDKILEL